MTPTNPLKALFFDIGGVLCSWHVSPNTQISKKLFSKWRESRTWHEYECGHIQQDECFSQLANLSGLSQEAVAGFIQQALHTVSQNNDMMELIKELRQRDPHLRIYALSNISQPDWAAIRKHLDWTVFDDIFTSHTAGMRKPELRFFQHVLRLTRIRAREAIFVDDREENIIAARSLGFRGAVLFNDARELRRILLNVLGDSVQRARSWLASNSGTLYSESETGVSIPDNFSQLLIYEVLGDMSLIRLKSAERTWNYFIGCPWGTTETYPDDADTTSYALKLLARDNSTVQSVLNEMLSSTTADGIMKVYFDDDRDRVDPAVCVNILRLFYHHGRGTQAEVQPTKDWAVNVLLYRGYVEGTRYYHTPEAFLYFFARLISENPGSDISAFKPLLKERLRERINYPTDAMSLAARVIACRLVDVSYESDLCQLLQKQQSDGSFEIGWLCQYGKTKLKIGSRGLTTALAVRAIEG